MSTGLFLKKDGITQSLTAMLNRTKHIVTFLERNTLRKYQQAQMRRWQTEGSSEGQSWTAITEPYKTYKKKKFASYEGLGYKTMIATGGLYRAATGRGPGFLKMISDTKFIVGIDLYATNPQGRRFYDYAAYAAEARPYMEFSDATKNEWKADIARYINSGAS